MQIIKILNNNVVISEENQEEIVLMGRGLAFGRKAGQEISLDLIEKKFILSADRKQLINEIDPEIIEIAGEVIAFAHKKISKKLKAEFGDNIITDFENIGKKEKTVITTSFSKDFLD